MAVPRTEPSDSDNPEAQGLSLVQLYISFLVASRFWLYDLSLPKVRTAAST